MENSKQSTGRKGKKKSNITTASRASTPERSAELDSAEPPKKQRKSKNFGKVPAQKATLNGI